MLGTMLAITLALSGAQGPTRADVAPKDTPTDQLAHQEATAPVQRIDRGTLTLERKGKPLEIRVDPDTPVFMDGRVAHVDELKPGAEVRVSYDAKGTSPKANWIEVVPRVAPSAPFDWSYP